MRTCIGATIRAVRQGADTDEEKDLHIRSAGRTCSTAVAALIPTHRPGATSVAAALTQPLQAADVGFAVLPDGRGGTNVESVVYTDPMGFDKQRSLEAFKTTASKRAGSPREAFLKARLLELREWAAAITLAQARQQALGTITTFSSSTR